MRILLFGRAQTRPRGFTLIELMMAVALVGVLAGIALPAYRAHRNKLLSAQAGQEIAAMATAIKLYYNDARAYPADLAAAGFSGRKDPWGNVYIYYNVAANGRGGARKDRALNPINTDFDLYSKGADGASASQISQAAALDDVIRARDGGFVGMASDF